MSGSRVYAAFWVLIMETLSSCIQYDSRTMEPSLIGPTYPERAESSGITYLPPNDIRREKCHSGQHSVVGSEVLGAQVSWPTRLSLSGGRWRASDQVALQGGTVSECYSGGVSMTQSSVRVLACSIEERFHYSARANTELGNPSTIHNDQRLFPGLCTPWRPRRAAPSPGCWQ